MKFVVCEWSVVGGYDIWGMWLAKFQTYKVCIAKQKSWKHRSEMRRKILTWKEIYQHIDHNWSHESQFVLGKCMLWKERKPMSEPCRQRLRQRFLTFTVHLSHHLNFLKIWYLGSTLKLVSVCPKISHVSKAPLVILIYSRGWEPLLKGCPENEYKGG